MLEEPQPRPDSSVNDWIKKPSPRVGQKCQEEPKKVENEYDMDCNEDISPHNVSLFRILLNTGILFPKFNVQFWAFLRYRCIQSVIGNIFFSLVKFRTNSFEEMLRWINFPCVELNIKYYLLSSLVPRSVTKYQRAHIPAVYLGVCSH